MTPSLDVVLSTVLVTEKSALCTVMEPSPPLSTAVAAMFLAIGYLLSVAVRRFVSVRMSPIRTLFLLLFVESWGRLRHEVGDSSLRKG